MTKRRPRRPTSAGATAVIRVNQGLNRGLVEDFYKERFRNEENEDGFVVVESPVSASTQTTTPLLLASLARTYAGQLR